MRVTNVSAKATEHDIHDFFSFSGEIENIELHRYAVSNSPCVCDIMILWRTERGCEHAYGL